MRQLITATADLRAGRSAPLDADLIDALGEVAENEVLEPAFRAQVLQLPGETDVAREVGQDVDPDAIASARNGLRAAIAQRLGRRLARLHDSLRLSGPYSPDAASAGKRALRNTLLDLMTGDGNRGAIDLTVSRFRSADNMTDRVAALAILSHAAAEERHAALDEFHARYSGDPLVIDKWLSLQATTPVPETLDRVKALMEHPAFSISNPNRIRALVGGFSAGNQTQFNRADGAGYDFVADFVLELDKRNPQTAARLLASFRSWRALEEGRRRKAETALNRIAAAEELSRDTRDIITRTLA
jgi:aminopeptidase N